MKLINTYREIRKVQKFRNNIETGFKYFWLLLERYEIGEVVFGEAARTTRFGKEIEKAIISNMPDGLKKNARKLHVVNNKKDIGLDCYLTLEDILEIISAPEEKFDEIPQIMNTLENIYSAIAIVGQNRYADKLQQYFDKNANLSVRRIEEKCITCEDGKYVIADKVGKDELVIWADLYADLRVVDADGNNVLSFFVKNFYKTGLKVMSYLTDIDEKIIPTLQENQVTVMKIYVANKEQLIRKKQVNRKLFYWKALRHLNDDIFVNQRHKKRGTEYLAEELKSLTNDNSKGYSEMYGNGKYINFDNGFRRTIGNEIGCKQNIYVFGPCFVRGLSSEDDGTIPSLLKKKVGSHYNVYNYGSEFHTCNFIMRNIEYKSGDIVIFFTPEKCTGENVDASTIHLDLTKSYNRIEDVENHVFDLLEHFDMKIQEQVVEDVYAVLEQSGALSAEVSSEKEVVFGPEKKRILEYQCCKDTNFKSWLSELQKKYASDGVHRGAIVMNCNPFTMGHRFLIEHAAEQVEELIIFVVEENKSVFSFEDRMLLVKQGVADLKNVTVLASGKYMISSMTLPGYFKKDELSDVLLDASTDLMLFLQIANALNISVRFAGEEPLDPFTCQYNENMRKILPRYGVEFKVIRRKEHDGAVISASRVRKALEKKDFEQIRELVPQSTYNYLVKNF